MAHFITPRIYLCLNKQEQSSTFLSSIFRSNKKDESHHISIAEDSKSVTLITRDPTGLLENSTSFSFNQVFRESTSLQTVYGNTAQDLVSQLFVNGEQPTNGCVVVYGSSNGEEKTSLFGSDAENGIVELLIDDLFSEMEKSHVNYEISCLVSELHFHELKNIPCGGDDLSQGSFYCKCESANSVLELLKALKNRNSATSFIITLKVEDIDRSTYGFFRIFLLPENEPTTPPLGPSATALASLERVFLQGPFTEETEADADNEMLTEILRSTVGICNTCIILSLSGQEHYPEQIMRKLRLGSKLCTYNTGILPNPAIIQSYNDFDDLSGSRLSLHASMVNSTLMNEEQSDVNAFSPEKCFQSQGRDSPQIQSDILLNIGKHLFEDAGHACRTVLNKNEETAKTFRHFWATCAVIMLTLFAAVSAALFTNMKVTNESLDDMSCTPHVLATNTTNDLNMNNSNFETTRKIIHLVQELDTFLSHKEYTTYNFKDVSVVLGLAFFVFASITFSMVSIILWLASSTANKLKKKKSKMTKSFPKKKSAGNSDGKSICSEPKKIKNKCESPYVKHPKIMSPIDTSKIFMSRYTGTVVLNNGIIADVVRSSRIGTPSPTKYGTPLSFEKLAKASPLDSSALPALKEEEDQSN